MKEEALKLAEYLEEISESEDGVDIELLNGSSLIRRLVEELDKQKEKAKWFEGYSKMLKETRDSLAMTVMLDQTSHDTAPQTKPLSDEEIEECYWGDGYPDNPRCPKDFARAIEERHGIK